MKELLKETSLTLNSNKCYPQKLRDEYTSECWEGLTEDVYKKLIENVKEYVEALQKNLPNPNTFYSKFYSEIVKESASYFTNLSPKAATLFTTTLANIIYQDIIKPVDSNQNDKNTEQKIIR